MNPYDTLGVDKNATDKEIKDAFREKAKQNHSDKGGDDNSMALINKAYSILKNKESRDHYDKTGSTEKTSFQQKLMMFINAEFMRIVENSKNVDNTDLINLLKISVRDYIGQKKELIKREETRIIKYEKVIKRLKVKGENLISVILNGHITDAKNTINLANIDIEFLQEVKELLKDYYYDYDKIKQPSHTHIDLSQFNININL